LSGGGSPPGPLSAAPAFPSEFTTRVPLSDPVMGFRHRYRDRTLDVVLPKVGGEA